MNFKSDTHRLVYNLTKKSGWVTPPILALGIMLLMGLLEEPHPQTVSNIINDLVESGRLVVDKLAALELAEKRAKLANIAREQYKSGIYGNLTDEQIEAAISRYVPGQLPDLSPGQLRNSPTIVRLSPGSRKKEGFPHEAGVGYAHHRSLANVALLLLADLYEVDFFMHTRSEFEIATSTIRCENDGEYWNESMYLLANGELRTAKKPDFLISFTQGKDWAWGEAEASRKKPQYRKDVADVRLALGPIGSRVSHIWVNQLIVVHGFRNSAAMIMDELEKQRDANRMPVIFHFVNINKRLGITAYNYGFEWQPGANDLREMIEEIEDETF